MSIYLLVYLVQLLVPVLLLSDILWAWNDSFFAVMNGGKLSVTARLVLAISVVWLTGGISALLFVRNRQAFLQRMASPLLSFFVILVLVLAGEWAIPSKVENHWTFLRSPKSNEVLFADPQMTPGCNGKKVFSVNELGVRGTALPDDAALYRIVAAGGSTTECLYLDDSEEWPHLLMTGLNTRQNHKPVWVGNAGYSGHTTLHTLTLLESLPVFRKAQMIILMAGINDLQATLELQGAPSDKALHRAVRNFMNGESSRHEPLYRKSQIFQRFQQLTTQRFRQRVSHSEKTAIDSMRTGWWYAPLRANRRNGPELPLPDLQVGVDEFRERIGKLGAKCRERGWRCLFLTQPTVWKSDLSPNDQNRLWFGWLGQQFAPNGHVGISDLAKAMQRYNDALLERCRQDGLECYDLASATPKDTSIFFDDCHFTDAGARLVSERLLEYLLSHPPFSVS